MRIGAQLTRKAGTATVRQAAAGVKAGATQLAKNPLSHLRKHTPGCVLGHNSFAAGTGVVTGVVLANDELNPDGEPHYALVTGVSHRTVYELHELTYIDDAGNVETLQTTADHELYARNLTGQAGWRKAHTLTPGDQLLQPDGTWSAVTGNILELAPAGVTVYNLSVSDGSTYYVDDGQGSASAVWVHNKNACKLARNLIKAGFQRGADEVPHHIVARGLFTRWVKSGANKAAKSSQSILKKHSIDLDSASNGVFLKNSVHKIESSAYIKAVNTRLLDADAIGGRVAVIKELRSIGNDLLSGKLLL